MANSTNDLKEWLNDNDLKSLYSKFESAGLTLQDIKSNTEQSLRELFDYIGCNPVQKIKLFTAIRSISDAVLNHPTKVILLSKQEQEIIEQFNEKNSKITESIQQIKDAINSL